MSRGAHSVTHDILGRGRRPLVGLLVAGIAVLGAAGAAWAFFTSTGVGTAHASVGTLAAPDPVGASVTGYTVTVSWTGVADPGPGTFGYYVTRTPSPPGSSAYVCGSSPTSVRSASTPIGRPSRGSSAWWSRTARPSCRPTAG